VIVAPVGRSVAVGLAAVATAGCNAVFGLDPVELGDGDGRPDAERPCLPSDHDEDLDGVPDRCDVCPHVPDDQADTDGDGVGDACDPSPEERHRFLLVDTFTASVNPWQTVRGTWAPTGDGLAQIDTGPVSTLAFLAVELPARAWVDAVFHIDSAVTTVAEVSVLSHVGNLGFDEPDSYRCTVSHADGGAHTARMEVVFGGALAFATSPVISGTFTVGSRWRVRLERDALPTGRCRIAQDAAQTSAALADNRLAGGFLAVRTSLVAATVEHVVVIVADTDTNADGTAR
jgi:hypothetical protein